MGETQPTAPGSLAPRAELPVTEQAVEGREDRPQKSDSFGTSDLYDAMYRRTSR